MTRARAVDATLCLLRLVAGLLLFQAGAVKWFGWYGGMPGAPPGTTIPLLSQLGVGAVMEVLGGMAIMLGFVTRPVAFILSGEMAVAYWQFHAPNGRWPAQNHGGEAVLLCFIFLFLAAQGAGEWSWDSILAKRAARLRAAQSGGDAQ